MLGPHSGMSGSGTEPVINFGQQTGHNCFQQHVLKQSFHEVVGGWSTYYLLLLHEFTLHLLLSADGSVGVGGQNKYNYCKPDGA